MGQWCARLYFADMAPLAGTTQFSVCPLVSPVKQLTDAIKIIAVSGMLVDVAFQHTHLPHRVLTHGL